VMMASHELSRWEKKRAAGVGDSVFARAGKSVRAMYVRVAAGREERVCGYRACIGGKARFGGWV